MRILLIVAVVVTGVVALESSSPITEQEAAMPLPNGRAVYEAPRHSAPFIVSLHLALPFTHFCSGTIIDPYWVVTAAICVYGTPESTVIYATAGLHEANKRSDGVTIKVVKRKVHQDYDGGVGPNNIALLKLAKPFDFYGETIAGIGMTSATQAIDRNCTSYGWGLFEDELQAEDVTSMYYSFCQSRLPVPGVSSSNICAYDEKSGGSCHGDFGTPLVCYYGEGRTNARLTGLLVWQPLCFIMDYPSLYTYIGSYVDWIFFTVFTN